VLVVGSGASVLSSPFSFPLSVSVTGDSVASSGDCVGEEVGDLVVCDAWLVEVFSLSLSFSSTGDSVGSIGDSVGEDVGAFVVCTAYKKKQLFFFKAIADWFNSTTPCETSCHSRRVHARKRITLPLKFRPDFY